MTKRRIWLYNMTIMGVFVCIVCLVAMRYIAEMGYTYIAFLDVGQGDATLIMHGGHQILVDGGPDGAVLQEELGRYMPFWDRTIDIVIASHPDSDHINGLVDVFNNFTVQQFWHTESGKDTSQYAALRHAAAHEKDMEDIIVRYGTRAHVVEGVDAEVIYPFNRNNATPHKDTNEDSIVLVVTVGNEKFYLGGDLPAQYEDMLPMEHVSVLKASHHGSKTSTSDLFLQKTHPRDIVISVGRDNRYGHPYQDVLDRMQKNGAQVYRTDERGAIVYRCGHDNVCQLIDD